MSKISLKLKITLWYVGVLIILSFFILYAMTMISQSFIVNNVEKNLIETVTSFSHTVKEANIIKNTNIPDFSDGERPNISDEMLPNVSEDSSEKVEHPEKETVSMDTSVNEENVDESKRIMPPPNLFNNIPEYSLFNQGIQMAVYDMNGDLVFGREPFGITTTFTFEDKVLKSEKYNGKTYCIYDRFVAITETESYWVKGVTCLSDETLAVQTMVQCNIFLILAFILVTGVGGYIILNGAFVPIKKIVNTAKDISESNDLTQRINIENGSDEIYSLANAFDGMLDKIEGSFEKEKQFTSDASHELRTPISVILSECEYGEECADTVEDLKEVISSVKSQATKMSKLVSELLMISRMDSHRLKLNFEEVDLGELLTFVCEEQMEIQAKKISLVQNIQDGVMANVDRLLITRLFINLISNAYQYSDEGTKITVSLHKDKQGVKFAVKDEGVGIAEENIPKIWDRFFQVDPSRTDEQDSSSGLGLPMVKWIAECHNSQLLVDSELGKGTTFMLVLPIE